MNQRHRMEKVIVSVSRQLCSQGDTGGDCWQHVNGENCPPNVSLERELLARLGGSLLI